MSQPFVRFHSVTFRYETAQEPLFRELSLHLEPGWVGVVGPNGSGKTTLLKLAAGMLEPADGWLDRPQKTVYCPQRTDLLPKGVSEFLRARSKSAQVIKGKLGVQGDWALRWEQLSHGERKRTQIAVALWKEPELLAIDEPTNHVDAEVRKLIRSILSSFCGVGLLVSHDRQLLDSLCQQCLFIDPPEVVMRPGGYTTGVQLAEAERKTASRIRTFQIKEVKRLRIRLAKRREAANQAESKRSKRGIARKDHDARQKIDLARLSGKDAVEGRRLRQADGRLGRAEERLEHIKVKKERPLGIWLPGTQSKRHVLLDLPAGSVPLGEHRRLCHPRLFLKPADRIAITGLNGAGKTTLVRKILRSLKLPRERVTYVPQEIDADQFVKILEDVRRLPRDERGHLMTIISRLGSRPHRLLESTAPSPGETRKLLLALGMTREPHVVIMDEPTNHMDLPSIECLEEALAECPCALLLVSHDETFLEKLTRRCWHIARESEETGIYRLNVADTPLRSQKLKR